MFLRPLNRGIDHRAVSREVCLGSRIVGVAQGIQKLDRIALLDVEVDRSDKLQRLGGRALLTALARSTGVEFRVLTYTMLSWAAHPLLSRAWNAHAYTESERGSGKNRATEETPASPKKLSNTVCVRHVTVEEIHSPSASSARNRKATVSIRDMQVIVSENRARAALPLIWAAISVSMRGL